MPDNEFCIKRGSRANKDTTIKQYFLSKKILDKKYNGNITSVETINDVILCNCMYDCVFSKLNIENNPARRIDHPGFATV